jgi:hypothetical protein
MSNKIEEPFADPDDPVPIEFWKVQPVTFVLGVDRPWFRLLRGVFGYKRRTGSTLALDA